MAIKKNEFITKLSDSLKTEILKLEKTIDANIEAYKGSVSNPKIEVTVNGFSDRAIYEVMKLYPDWNIVKKFEPGFDQRDPDKTYIVLT